MLWSPNEGQAKPATTRDEGESGRVLDGNIFLDLGVWARLAVYAAAALMLVRILLLTRGKDSWTTKTE